MAEIHNISDLRVINYLKRELDGVKEVLQQVAHYDPTESYAEMVENTLKASCNAYYVAKTELNLAQREISYLNSQIHALKLEKINEKVPDSGDLFGYCFLTGGLKSNCAQCRREAQDSLRQGQNSPSGR